MDCRLVLYPTQLLGIATPTCIGIGAHRRTGASSGIEPNERRCYCRHGYGTDLIGEWASLSQHCVNNAGNASQGCISIIFGCPVGRDAERRMLLGGTADHTAPTSVEEGGTG